MKMPVCRRYIVFLVICSALWTCTAQAFFCFSMNGGGGHRKNHYLPPPPIGAFGYDSLPALYYAGPAMPQRAIAPVEIRNADYPALEPPIAPVELPDTDYPVQDATIPKQHIFH